MEQVLGLLESEGEWEDGSLDPLCMTRRSLPHTLSAVSAAEVGLLAFLLHIWGLALFLLLGVLGTADSTITSSRTDVMLIEPTEFLMSVSMIMLLSSSLSSWLPICAYCYCLHHSHVVFIFICTASASIVLLLLKASF